MIIWELFSLAISPEKVKRYRAQSCTEHNIWGSRGGIVWETRYSKRYEWAIDSTYTNNACTALLFYLLFLAFGNLLVCQGGKK